MNQDDTASIVFSVIYSGLNSFRSGSMSILFSISLFFLSIVCSFAQTKPYEVKNQSFQNGEKIAYQVYYNWGFIWFNAAKVEFSVTADKMSDKRVYHIVSIGNTYESYDWIYKVRDKYETFIDQKTFLPIKFIRDVKEGSLKIYQSAIFDYDQKKIYIKDKVIDLPDYTQDVLSAVYYSRNIDFSGYKPNDLIPIVLFIDDKVYNLKIKYLGKEVVQTYFGKYNCIKFRPQLVEGTIFKGGDEMVVWVSDDENKVPIRVETPILVGSIKVDLSAYYGLKYPLRAKVK